MSKPTHNPITDLFAMIEKGKIEKTFKYTGKDWTFRSLNDEDCNWRDSFLNTASGAALLASVRAPELAIACVAIDGIPVNQLPEMVEPDEDATPELVARIKKEGPSPLLVAYNLLHKLFNKLPRPYLVGLHELYEKEVENAVELTEDAVKNS